MFSFFFFLGGGGGGVNTIFEDNTMPAMLYGCSSMAAPPLWHMNMLAGRAPVCPWSHQPQPVLSCTLRFMLLWSTADSLVGRGHNCCKLGEDRFNTSRPTHITLPPLAESGGVGDFNLEHVAH